MNVNIFKSYIHVLLKRKLFESAVTNNIRHSSYQNSVKVEDIQRYTLKYQVSKSPEDWKCVERTLQPLVVPVPQHKNKQSVLWKPPTAETTSAKYYVERNKNHMIPVYLSTSHRGMRKLTVLRKVHGDIFSLEQNLKKEIEQKVGKAVASQVNELVGYIHFKGDYVRIVKDFLLEKGF